MPGPSDVGRRARRFAGFGGGGEGRGRRPEREGGARNDLVRSVGRAGGGASQLAENPLQPRLLKKVQMQGGAHSAGTHRRWVGGVLRVRRSERASAPTPHPLPPCRQRGEMLGLFQQPVKRPR